MKKVECIVEQGSRENVTYVGFVFRETDDAVVLAFFEADHAKSPYQVIKKARILERHELTRVRASAKEAVPA